MVQISGRWQRMMMALAAFVVSAVATVLAATGSSPTSTAAAGPAHTAPASSSSSPRTATAHPLRIGISYGDTLTWKSDKDLAAGLNDAVTLGAGWIRVDLSWYDIQPDNAVSYDWERFDRIVEAARARNLDVLPTIAYTPPWARKAGCKTQSCPPADPQVFADFAKDVAERYGPLGLHTWEIWNEPNIGVFWNPKPDPEAYTQLLRDTAKAVRAVQPNAYVLMGGLSASLTNNKTGHLSPTDFLGAVSKLGGNRAVNAISYHPYNYPYLPSARTAAGTAFETISTAKDNLVAVLDKYGTPKIPIWITETGAPTVGPGPAADGKADPSGTTHVTEAFQARIATDTLPTAAANPHVDALFWFADRDSGTDKAVKSDFFGLRRYDGTAKPAFDALKKAIATYKRQQ